MGWPQITMIALWSFGLAIYMAKHGETHPDYNAFSYAIGIAITATILYFGGFFG